MAVIAVLSFYMPLRAQLKEYRPMVKLLAFKVIVGLGFIEKVVTFPSLAVWP
jgi:hypothetical protein